MPHKPSWLTDPDARKTQLRSLAERGVSRTVIRSVAGWNNNQMAGFTNHAGFAFKEFAVGPTAAMRQALIDAGFDTRDIDAALSHVPTPGAQKAQPVTEAKRSVRSAKKKEVPIPHESMPTKREGNDAVLPPTHAEPEQRAETTEEEVERATRDSISRATGAADVMEMPQPRLPSTQDPLPPRKKRAAPLPVGCQWPMFGRTLKGTVCGKPTDGKFCETHQKEIDALVRRK